MKTKKINWLLILQAWAMLWVVIGHSRLVGESSDIEANCHIGGGNPLWASILGGFPYSFHMALFIMISGWLFYRTRIAAEHKRWKYGEMLWEKFLRLGIPMLFFTAIAMVLKVLMSSDVHRSADFSLQYYLYSLIFPYNGPMREMWFVLTIFWCFALSPLWKWSLQNSYRIMAFTFILLCLNLWDPEIYFLSIGRLCRFALFFYSGILFCKYDVLEKMFDRKLLLVIVGVILLAIGEYLNGLLGSFVTIGRLCSAIGGISSSIGICFIIEKLLPMTFITFRNYTYQIYLMGIFFQILLKMVYRRIDMPYIVGFLLCIIVGIYGPVIISKILLKINLQPLLLCIGLKKRDIKE